MQPDSRLRTLQQNLQSYYMVSDPHNLRYLTGFFGAAPTEHEAFALINQHNAKLIVPLMYQEYAKKLSLVQEGSVQLVVDEKKEGLFAVVLRELQSLNSSNMMIDEKDLCVAELRKIESQKIVCASSLSLVEHMRIIKDVNELELVRQADEMTRLTLIEFEAWLKSQDCTQKTELDCVEKIRKIALRLGADGLSFDPIVASGAASSQPHYTPSRAKIQNNAVLLVDIGVKLGGYCGDRTATFVVGHVPAEIEHVIRVVREAHDRCVAMVADGVTGKQLYDELWRVYVNDGLPATMPHSLGHGVGLEIHEAPFLRALEDQPLKKGMAVTIEPGYYVEGKFGVRIESAVIV